MKDSGSTGLLTRAASFSGLTLLSRLTGVVRDVVIATVFGAGAATDAFVLAFRIPNSLRRLFADGALSAAFIPALVREREHADPLRIDSFVARMAGTLAVVVMLVAGLAMLLATPLALLFAPGSARSPAQVDLLAQLLRITFPFLPCVSLAALAGAVLMSHGRYTRWALAPALLNLCMIAAALALASHLAVPITALAWGVLAGGLLQVAWLWAGVARIGVRVRPAWGAFDPRVRAVSRAMLPTVAGASVAQLNLVFASAVASMLHAGSQTWLFQADRFLELPLALLGASMGIVLLPALSREFARDDGQAARTLAWALRGTVLTTLPATTGLLLLSEPLMTTFFQYGRYSAFDAAMSARALALMSLGLPALVAIKTLLPAYYARGDLASPVRMAGVSLLFNAVASVLLLMLMLALALAPGAGADLPAWHVRLAALPGLHALLALASAMANTCNAFLLWRGLRRAGVLDVRVHDRRQLARVGVACALMAAVLVPLRDCLDFGALGVAGRVGALLALVGTGGLTFLLAWRLLGGRLSSLGNPPR
ncbi:MAG TPA: murein biosynthesis integral membrane protein MurJ [Stenotrophomonas sp.]|nr:murein biosynthesis integral membrane protein MurJ [Stenotrophomonas sp.]